MNGMHILITINLFQILTSSNANTLVESKSIDNEAVIKDIKMLTTIKAKLYTYKTNIIYFTNKTRILLDYLDDMNAKRILIQMNQSSSPAFKPERNCRQFELILNDENTTKTFVCLNGIQLAYNKFVLSLQGPSEFTTDCRLIMLIDSFNDVHRFTNVIMRHPNLIKIVYAANDCDLNEFELYKYYKCLWDINRILYLQYISHCDTRQSTVIYSFTPFVQNHFRGFNVFGAITQRNFTNDLVVDVKFNNFNGYKLDALFFPTTMAFLKSKLNSTIFKAHVPRHNQYEIQDLDSFYGVDANVLKMWIEMHNFTVNTIPTSDGNHYGYRDEYGKFNGGLGDIIDKRVEFIANGYFIKDYESRLIEFSHAVISEKLCVIVKTADLVPSSLILVRCFSSTVWISIVITLIVVGISYALLMQINLILFEIKETQRNDFKKHVRFHNDQKSAAKFIGKSIEMMSKVIGILVNAPIINIGHMQHERIFLTACFLWSLNISGAFQGSLVDVYTTPTSYRDIDTLDHLDRADIPIAVRHPGLIVDIFGSNGRGDTIGNLRSKMYPINDDFLHAEIAHHGKLATLERLADFQIQSSPFMRKDGVSYLHLVKECPRGYLLSYLFPKSSIFLETINFDLNILLQSGLISKWEKDTFYFQNFAGAMANRKFLNPSRIKLTLNHLQVAFLILGLGISFSILTFLMEIYCKPVKKIQR